MLFCDHLSRQEVLEAKQTNREDLLAGLVTDFRKTFPDLTFELQLDFSIINAQALRLANKQLVTIYGGLALHPRLGSDGLTLIVLHEVGHHLAEGCRSKRDPSLACECAADYWAVTTGAADLRLRTNRSLRMQVAVEQLDAVLSPRQPSKGKYTKTNKSSGCWAGGWPSRRSALLARDRSPQTTVCCISHI
jgi:hypothetical protein